MHGLGILVPSVPALSASVASHRLGPLSRLDHADIQPTSSLSNSLGFTSSFTLGLFPRLLLLGLRTARLAVTREWR